MNRRTKKLWAWMTLNDVAVKAVAAANGISLSAVYQYLRGDMPSTNLRTWFLGQGCPAGNLPPVRKIAPKKTNNIGKAA
jgi:hypothetical protein